MKRLSDAFGGALETLEREYERASAAAIDTAAGAQTLEAGIEAGLTTLWDSALNVRSSATDALRMLDSALDPTSVPTPNASSSSTQPHTPREATRPHSAHSPANFAADSPANSADSPATMATPAVATPAVASPAVAVLRAGLPPFDAPSCPPETHLDEASWRTERTAYGTASEGTPSCREVGLSLLHYPQHNVILPYLPYVYDPILFFLLTLTKPGHALSCVHPVIGSDTFVRAHRMLCGERVDSGHARAAQGRWEWGAGGREPPEWWREAHE